MVSLSADPRRSSSPAESLSSGSKNISRRSRGGRRNPAPRSWEPRSCCVEIRNSQQSDRHVLPLVVRHVTPDLGQPGNIRDRVYGAVDRGGGKAPRVCQKPEWHFRNSNHIADERSMVEIAGDPVEGVVVDVIGNTVGCAAGLKRFGPPSAPGPRGAGPSPAALPDSGPKPASIARGSRVSIPVRSVGVRGAWSERSCRRFTGFLLGRILRKGKPRP